MDRPASGPRVWSSGRIPFVAPVDDRAGGTWFGINARGLVAGITNRFMAPRYADRRSRGTVVTDALGYPDVETLHAALSRLDPGSVNAFHLLYADPSGAAGVTWTDGAHLCQERLPSGVHILTERSLGAAEAVPARVTFVRSRWPAPRADGTPDAEALMRLLSHHDEADPLAATCVHVPAFNYGTRSSTVLLVADDPARSQYWAADDSPCRAPFVDRSALLSSL
ncbi:MAG: NRDE family protein [Myxococcaceae bacterium]|nr:NRDE family protein [Myxococcaceae bacterium]